MRPLAYLAWLLIFVVTFFWGFRREAQACCTQNGTNYIYHKVTQHYTEVCGGDCHWTYCDYRKIVTVPTGCPNAGTAAKSVCASSLNNWCDANQTGSCAVGCKNSMTSYYEGDSYVFRNCDYQGTGICAYDSPPGSPPCP